MRYHLTVILSLKMSENIFFYCFTVTVNYLIYVSLSRNSVTLAEIKIVLFVRKKIVTSLNLLREI